MPHPVFLPASRETPPETNPLLFSAAIVAQAPCHGKKATGGSITPAPQTWLGMSRNPRASIDRGAGLRLVSRERRDGKQRRRQPLPQRLQIFLQGGHGRI